MTNFKEFCNSRRTPLLFPGQTFSRKPCSSPSARSCERLVCVGVHSSVAAGCAAKYLLSCCSHHLFAHGFFLSFLLPNCFLFLRFPSSYVFLVLLFPIVFSCSLFSDPWFLLPLRSLLSLLHLVPVFLLCSTSVLVLPPLFIHSLCDDVFCLSLSLLTSFTVQ